ncbi:MAG: hypothetical protein ACW98K_18310 [Candidatus Kariarchaeaceae archaeon]|jgi:hypothetical protein
MGIDIYSGRGVIFTVDEFLKVINGKNKSNVVSVCHAFHKELVDEANADTDEASVLDQSKAWRSQIAEHYKALSTLKTTMKLDEIREIIASVVEVEGEVSKYGQCYVTDSEYIEDLFTKILGVSRDIYGVDLPYIQEVTAWGSGRNNGWDVPKGVACVVFDSESCFERTLSDQGKALKKFLGHCNETEWTEMSY